MKQGIPEEIFFPCWNPNSTDFDGDENTVMAYLAAPGGLEKAGLGTVRKVGAGLFGYTPTVAETLTGRLMIRLKAPGMVTSPKEVGFMPANGEAPDLTNRNSISRYTLLQVIAGIRPALGTELWLSSVLNLGDSIPLTGRFLDGLQAAFPGLFDELSNTQED